MEFKTGYSRYEYEKPKNSFEPPKLTVDFKEDLGYFTAENGVKSWQVENGVMRTLAKDEVNTAYIHVYETNVSEKARVRLLDAEKNARFAMVLRCNSEEAFVRAVYHGEDGTWCIDWQEGADFLPFRSRFCKFPMEDGEWHDIEFKIDAGRAELFIDSQRYLAVDNVAHLSSGRTGFAARNTACEIQSVELTLLSDQGTVMKNVAHTVLPDNEYREGGTVVEQLDGTLSYTHPWAGCGFRSTDNGTSWERTEEIYKTVGRAHIIRLRNGKLIKIDCELAEERPNSTISAYISEDDGKTFKKVGKVCGMYLEGYPNVPSCNMNDKVSELSDGRIYYCQNYETREPVNGCTVFCKFYYSDDEGKTWHKSKTDSWDLEGNIGKGRFGECKVLECADGTLRIYNSWNEFWDMVYSESTDRGETWGPIVHMTDFRCSCSSLQLCRDIHADNDFTYYMVWISSPSYHPRFNMPRSRLSLAKTEDGKNWVHLGDIWRWECPYTRGGVIAHLVDTFITVTKEHVICGSGISEREPNEFINGSHFHMAQRQHIYSIKKSTLEPTTLRGVLDVTPVLLGTAFKQ